MNIFEALLRTVTALGTIGLLTFSTASFAERVSLHVAFGDVPGLEELESGQFDAAISLLEARKAAQVVPMHNERSTLCAAYILARRFNTALPVCDEAIQSDDEDIAYNNRGVLRAHLGDYAGALRDFEVIRLSAQEQASFLEAIRKVHPRTMATANYEVLQRIQEQKLQPGMSFKNGHSAAQVESIRP